jgi:hypothetical protein
MPRVKMTRTARIALWFVQCYLVVLLILLMVKFIKVIF